MVYYTRAFSKGRESMNYCQSGENSQMLQWMLTHILLSITALVCYRECEFFCLFFVCFVLFCFVLFCFVLFFILFYFWIRVLFSFFYEFLLKCSQFCNKNNILFYILAGSLFNFIQFKWKSAQNCDIKVTKHGTHFLPIFCFFFFFLLVLHAFLKQQQTNVA